MEMPDLIKFLSEPRSYVFPSTDAKVFPRLSLKESGLPSAALSNFLDAVENLAEGHVHSFMLLQHGKVLTEGYFAPYRPKDRSNLYSVSKTLTSMATGFAVQEGKLDISSKVIDFFPEEASKLELTEWQKQLSVQDLLTMETGHGVEPWDTINEYATSPLQSFFAVELTYEPGTHFIYNSCGSYMISLIVSKVVGEPICSYLEPRLFTPLGIENPYWEHDANGNNWGGWGLWLSTEEMAVVGQFYLQKGNWNGEQLLDKSWFDRATTPKSYVMYEATIDWKQGYGLHFWRGTHNHFRGDGTAGQLIVVYPELDAVLIMTGANNISTPLEAAQDSLITALEGKFESNSSASIEEVEARLAQLTIDMPAGIKGRLPDSFSLAEPIVGYDGDAELSVNISWDHMPSALIMSFSNGEEITSIAGGWYCNTLYYNNTAYGRIVWSNETTATVYIYSTPMEKSINLTLNSDSVTIESSSLRIAPTVVKLK